MTEPQPKPELITIRKQDLLEFVASIWFQIEEYQTQDLTHGFEISGYQDSGGVFIIDCASHDPTTSADKVLDELEKACATNIKICEDAVIKYPEMKDANNGSIIAFTNVQEWIAELRERERR